MSQTEIEIEAEAENETEFKGLVVFLNSEDKVEAVFARFSESSLADDNLVQILNEREDFRQNPTGFIARVIDGMSEDLNDEDHVSRGFDLLGSAIAIKSIAEGRQSDNWIAFKTKDGVSFAYPNDVLWNLGYLMFSVDKGPYDIDDLFPLVGSTAPVGVVH